jgi:hypothetical protein
MGDPPPGALASSGGETFLEDGIRIMQATGADFTACPEAEASTQELPGERQRELVRLFATAFFDYYLKGDEGTSHVLTTEFAQTLPEVELDIGQASTE